MRSHGEGPQLPHDDIPIAIGVIRTDLAEFRRGWLYELGMVKRAREIGADLVELLHHSADDAPVLDLMRAVYRHRAAIVIAPSLQHVSGAERLITRHHDLYLVGRSRVFRRGHRWFP